MKKIKKQNMRKVLLVLTLLSFILNINLVFALDYSTGEIVYGTLADGTPEWGGSPVTYDGIDFTYEGGGTVSYIRPKINPTSYVTELIFGLSSDILSINDNGLNVTGNITPTITETQSIGSSALRWLKGWFSSLDIAGNLNQTNGNATINNIYGEMYYHNHTGTNLNFAVDGVFYNLTFSESKTNGFLFNDADDYLEAQVAGRYLVNYMASGDGQNNHIYYTAIFVNGINQNSSESHKKMTAGGDIITMTGSGFIDLIVGDKVKLATADIGGTGTGNYYSANLNLVRIGNL